MSQELNLAVKCELEPQHKIVRRHGSFWLARGERRGIGAKATKGAHCTFPITHPQDYCAHEPA